MRRPTFVLVLLLAVLASAGCSYLMPPEKIPLDRRNYLDAVSTSWKEQLLNNLVKLRYGDPLTCLEMTSVTTGYELDANLTAAYPVAWHPLRGTAGFRNVVGVGGSTTYMDKPSITYVPMRGDELAKTMVDPIPLPQILKSLQTGWAADYIFSCCVKSINGLRNRTSTGEVPADYHFFDLVQLFNDLKANGVILITVTETAEPKVTKVPKTYDVTLHKTWKGQGNGGGTAKKNDEKEDTSIGSLVLDKARAEYLDNSPKRDEKPTPQHGPLEFKGMELIKPVPTLVLKKHETGSDKMGIDPPKEKSDETFVDKITRFKELLWANSLPLEKERYDSYNSKCLSCHGAKDPSTGPGSIFSYLNSSDGTDSKLSEEDMEQKIKQAVTSGCGMGKIAPSELESIITVIKHAFARYEVYKIYDGNQGLPLDPDCDKIVLQARSILEVLNLLSRFINVPTDQIHEHRALPSKLVNEKKKEALDGDGMVFEINSMKEHPPDAFVAVQSHGFWFYIREADIISKQVFSFTAGIISMSETGTSQGTPVLTLPVQ